MLYTKVQYSTSTDCCTPPAYLYMVCSYMESNSVLVTDGDITSVVSPTRRGTRLNTFGMRNPRQNGCFSLEVCIFWLGCLICTTTVVGTYWKHGLGRFHDEHKYVIRNTNMGGEVSRISASMIKLIWSSTQFLQLLLKPCPQVDAMYWFRFLILLLSPSHQRSPFLLMINQNQTSPAPRPQNQPPDLGPVHGSQRKQLCLSLHRSHRVRFCVSSVFCLSPKERSGAIGLSRRIMIFRDSRHLKILG